MPRTRQRKAPPPAVTNPVYRMTKAEALDLARRHLEREFRVLMEAEKAEYLADTGHAMPTTIEEMKVAARLAGFTAGEAEAGDYTLAAIHRQAVATKKIDQREAVAIAQHLRAVDAPHVKEKPARSTKPKQEELDGYRLLLVKRLAEQRAIDIDEALLLVDRMSHQQFADAIGVEFNASVCRQTVKRWRRKKKKTQRPAGGSSPPVKQAARPAREQHVIDASGAKQGGLEVRSRIDGVSRLAAGDDPENLVEERRRLEAEAADLVAWNGKAECKCHDPATRSWRGKPVCADCYDELEAEAAAK